jgi:carboxylesterase
MYYTDNHKFDLKGSSDIGVLLIHGFSGSPAEMKGVGDYLNSKGYNILGSRVAGHGGERIDLKDVSYKDWVLSVEEDYLNLSNKYKEVYIVGFSMGSLLSLKIAEKYQPSGVVLMSPPMLRKAWMVNFLPLIKYFIPWYDMKNQDRAKTFKLPYTYCAYPKVPTEAVGELLRLVRDIRNGIDLDCPVVVLQGRKDKVIPESSGKELLELIQTSKKSLEFFKNSVHQIMLDKEREQVWQRIYNFILNATN